MSVPRSSFSFATVSLVVILFLAGVNSFGHAQTLPSFVLSCTIATYGNGWDGEFTFGLWKANATSGLTDSYLVVMNTNGTVEYLRYNGQQPNYPVVKNIAQDTLLFQGEPNLGGPSIAGVFATHIWNYVTNKTTDFPNVDGHHDVEYNPVNNTFLTLNDYVAVVDNNSILFDKIVELDASGNILWSWDTFNHIPPSDGDPFNPTAVVNGLTVQDFTHANALDWDYNNSIIYLNLRHTNTFYKIDQNTGNVIWACGEHGNFTLLSDNGTAVKSLWYHSHGTKQIAPDVFTMFDNDFNNETNPDNCKSRMIEVKMDEQNMTARVSWSWTAQKQYWTPYFGEMATLPNGDRIGTFGSPTHQFPQNQPWDFNDTGAVLIEVNQNGTVVRTYTFPPGWNIYRLEELKYPSSVVPTIPESSSAIILTLCVTVSTAVAALKRRPREKRKSL